LFDGVAEVGAERLDVLARVQKHRGVVTAKCVHPVFRRPRGLARLLRRWDHVGRDQRRLPDPIERLMTQRVTDAATRTGTLIRSGGPATHEPAFVLLRLDPAIDARIRLL
jgi:hypothetical protein